MSAAPARILVVDDAAGPRETLAALLEVEGHEVVQAGTLGEGRSLAGSSRFDVVIADRGLPDGDGAALVAQLAALPVRPWLMVLSGREALAVPGADLCVQKGGAPAELVLRIAALLERER